MKKVIGIYCGDCGYDLVWDDEIVRNQGAGGSETWVVEIASEFQRRGFHVIVFGNPPYWRFAVDGVEYFPRENFRARCEYQHFDYFIFWREIDEMFPTLDCPEIYVIAEDMYVHSRNGMHFNKIKKVAYLSEWAKEFLKSRLLIPDENLFKTFNPVPIDNYLDVDTYTKKNKMVWSSTVHRVLPYFLKEVFPRIKEAVPDFTVDVCSYLNTDTSKFKTEGVNFLGKLNKKELSEVQKESKIWTYPNDGIFYTGNNDTFFQETFCNTAVENGLAKNAVFCFNIGGVADTMEKYEGVIGRDLGDKYLRRMRMDDDDLLYATDKIVESSIKALTDEDYRRDIANKAFEICKKYSPSNSVDTWLKEWKIIK